MLTRTNGEYYGSVVGNSREESFAQSYGSILCGRLSGSFGVRIRPVCLGGSVPTVRYFSIPSGVISSTARPASKHCGVNEDMQQSNVPASANVKEKIGSLAYY